MSAGVPGADAAGGYRPGVAAAPVHAHHAHHAPGGVRAQLLQRAAAAAGAPAQRPGAAAALQLHGRRWDAAATGSGRSEGGAGAVRQAVAG